MPPTDDAPLLLAVDGNSLLHRAHHAWAGPAGLGGGPVATTGAGPVDGRDADGRPIWGLRGLVIAIAAAAARLRPDAVLVGFDCTEHSARRATFAGYKAHRPEKSLDLADELDRAPEVLRQAGFAVLTQYGCEADDVLASAAAQARERGWRSMLVTSDRDSFALIDEHTSVLRVVNGGIGDSPIVGPDDVRAGYGVAPAQYRDLAALRGDPSDNLRGAWGVGPKHAATLIARFGSLDNLLAQLDNPTDDDEAAVIAEIASLVGATAASGLADPTQRAELARTGALMRMRTDLDLPPWESLLLPIDHAGMRNALQLNGITLGPALWALTGQEPPPWSPQGYDRAPAYLPNATEPPPWALSHWVPIAQWDEYAAASSGESPGQAATARVVAAPRSAAQRPAQRSAGRAAIVLDGQLSLF